MGCHLLAGDRGDGYRGSNGDRHDRSYCCTHHNRSTCANGYRGTRENRDNCGNGYRGTSDNGGTRDNRRNEGSCCNHSDRSVAVTPACRCAPCGLWHGADLRWCSGRDAWRGPPTS